MVKRNVIESCIRSIAEADAIAYVDGHDKKLCSGTDCDNFAQLCEKEP